MLPAWLLVRRLWEETTGGTGGSDLTQEVGGDWILRVWITVLG